MQPIPPQTHTHSHKLFLWYYSYLVRTVFTLPTSIFVIMFQHPADHGVSERICQLRLSILFPPEGFLYTCILGVLFFRVSCTRSNFPLHLQRLGLSTAPVSFQSPHNGIHALISPVSVPQKTMSFAVNRLVILLPADSLPTFCCFSLNHI